MKILVYGAGPLGSFLAARLHEAGNDVSLLARGQRLTDLREHGVVLMDTETGKETVARPAIVERLEPGDAFDLVMVVMRKNRALEILPVLAANKHTPNVLFLMNNAAGPDALVQALGAERVMMGFPMAAGYRRGHVIHYLFGGRPGKPVKIPIGEADGSVQPRTREIAAVFDSMPGFAGEIRTDMDAWLKTHVALLMPSLAPAMRAAGRDNVRMGRTRDAVVLAVRAIREGFGVVRKLGYPVVPSSIRQMEWMPEPILVWYLQKLLPHPRMRTATLEHADAAQDEIRHLAGEFDALIERAGIPTPVIDGLKKYFDPDTPALPEGSAEIPLDWRFLYVVAGILVIGALIVLGLWLL
ncbi:MAG: ketopantoate reductase family protein [Anaerolineales bacterium]|nr:ketopantoate reductase family protein [Anaerolineales bacterium]